MQYIRASDGMTVDRSEACTPGGQVRSGYSIRVPTVADGERVGFEAAFMDRALPGGRTAFRDGVSLTDAETTRAVALAKRQHDLSHAYKGSRAPAFTDAQASAAVTAATATKRATTLSDSALGIRDAETAAHRVVRDATLARRREEIRNAWKK